MPGCQMHIDMTDQVFVRPPALLHNNDSFWHLSCVELISSWECLVALFPLSDI